jgi:hypothetical protein
MAWDDLAGDAIRKVRGWMSACGLLWCGAWRERLSSTTGLLSM